MQEYHARRSHRKYINIIVQILITESTRLLFSKKLSNRRQSQRIRGELHVSPPYIVYRSLKIQDN